MAYRNGTTVYILISHLQAPNSRFHEILCASYMCLGVATHKLKFKAFQKSLLWEENHCEMLDALILWKSQHRHMCVKNPAKHLAQSFLWKPLTVFAKNSPWYAWHGSEYASDQLGTPPKSNVLETICLYEVIDIIWMPYLRAVEVVFWLNRTIT